MTYLYWGNSPRLLDECNSRLRRLAEAISGEGPAVGQLGALKAHQSGGEVSARYRLRAHVPDLRLERVLSAPSGGIDYFWRSEGATVNSPPSKP